MCQAQRAGPNLKFQLHKDFVMPQNTKDSKGGKTAPTKDTGTSAGKTAGKGKADAKSSSPAGSQNKGEKKTTP